MDGRYEESVALQPWDYGGPQHVNRAPYVAIVDPDGVLIDIEDGLGERFAAGEPFAAEDACAAFTSIAVRAGGPLRALLLHPRAEAESTIVRATTLGCLDVDAGESCGRWLGQRPGELLKFLICRRYGVVHAQDVAAALWGHGGFVSSGTVRQCVHELRHKAEQGRAGCPELVLTRQCGYALSRNVAVDADDFAVHVRRGIAALGRDQGEIAIVHLRQAVSMYRGDFLSDEPLAEWARPERERLREHLEDALRELAQLYLTAADPSAAISCLRRLAEMLPYDVDVHRRLLSVMLSHGRHSHAQRCYRAFCTRLWRDFSQTAGFTLADVRPAERERAVALGPPPRWPCGSRCRSDLHPWVAPGRAMRRERTEPGLKQKTPLAAGFSVRRGRGRGGWEACHDADWSSPCR